MVKSVFEINDYREASKFLQEKYDALGYTREDYFRITEAGKLRISDKTGKPAKNSKVGRGSVGLQYHHICLQSYLYRYSLHKCKRVLARFLRSVLQGLRLYHHP